MFFKALILGRTGVCRCGKSNRARPAQVVKGQVFDSQFLAGGLEDPVDEVGRVKVARAADVTEHKYAVSGRSSSLEDRLHSAFTSRTSIHSGKKSVSHYPIENRAQELDLSVDGGASLGGRTTPPTTRRSLWGCS